MKRKLNLLALMAALCLAGTAGAAMKGSADVVTAKPQRSVLTAAPGAAVEFAVDLDIAEHWHLYAHGDTNFIGVDLIPADDFPLAGYDAVYPEGFEGDFFGDKVVMIAGSQVITAKAKVPADLAPGEHALNLSLRVQACDDKTCLAPANVPVKLTLKVE